MATRAAQAACAARDAAQEHLAASLKTRAAVAALASKAPHLPPPKPQADPFTPLRPFTRARDAQGVVADLDDATARHSSAERHVVELEAQIRERRSAVARLRQELAFVTSVARDGVAGMGRASTEEAAADAVQAQTDALRAEEEAAAAESEAASLAEGMRALWVRLQAVEAQGGAPAPPLPAAGLTLASVDSLVAAVELAARAAQLAAAQRQLAAAAPAAQRAAVQCAGPLRRCRHRRRVDSDGFEVGTTDSEASARESTGSECSRQEERGTSAAERPTGSEGTAEAPEVPTPAAHPAVDVRRLWGVHDDVAMAGRPGTAGGADTARTDGGGGGCGGGVLTRDALKARSAAAARAAKQADAGGGEEMRGRGGRGGRRSSARRGPLLGATVGHTATCALLSSKTPSADALLHSLQTLSRRVEASWLPPTLAPAGGGCAPLTAPPQPTPAPLGRFAAAAAAARSGARAAAVSHPRAAPSARSCTPEPMLRRCGQGTTATAAAHASVRASSAPRAASASPARARSSGVSARPPATPPSPQACSSSASGHARRASSPLSSREPSFGSASLRVRTK